MVISNLDFLPGLLLWLIHGESCSGFVVSRLLSENLACSRITQSAVCELNFSDMVAFSSNLGK